jgi:hypothetical protein
MLAGLGIVALIAAACGSSTPSPSPSASGSPAPDGSTGPATGFRLRATLVQALPPLDTFTWTPMLLISDDLVAIQAGAIPLIFPGPLVTPLLGAQLTEQAWGKLESEARAAGLLSGETDFTGGALVPGAEAGRLEIVVGGTTYDLTGDPGKVTFCGDRPCAAEPGTPAAFATFFSLLGNLPAWVGGVGAQQPWVPAGYAVIAGPAPAADPQLPQAVLPWPFGGPSAEFGDVVSGDPTRRCGIVMGDEAAALTAALGAANQLTPWRDPAAPDDPGSLLGLTIRPLLPGDGDLCAPFVDG